MNHFSYLELILRMSNQSLLNQLVYQMFSLPNDRITEKIDILKRNSLEGHIPCDCCVVIPSNEILQLLQFCKQLQVLNFHFIRKPQRKICFSQLRCFFWSKVEKLKYHIRYSSKDYRNNSISSDMFSGLRYLFENNCKL